MAKVIYNMRAAGTNRRFTVSGSDDTVAGALAEANAKLKITVGTVESSSQSGPITGTAGAAHAAGTYEDLILTVVKAGVYRTIRIENVSTAYALADTDGILDTDQTDITDFVAAWSDGTGTTGYTLVAGQYVK